MMRNYLARKLAPGSAAALEEHLHDWPDCAAFIKTYKRTAQTLQSVCHEDIPAEMQTRGRQFPWAKIKRFPPGR